METKTTLELMAEDTDLVWLVITAGISEMRRKAVINQEAAVSMMKYVSSLRGCPEFIKYAAANCIDWPIE